MCTRILASTIFVNDLMVNGVTLIAPERVILEDGVVVGAETVIEPDVTLMGTTVIGRGCRIEQSVRLLDSEVGDGSHIKAFSYLEKTRVNQNCQVGPFARLRDVWRSIPPQRRFHLFSLGKRHAISRAVCCKPPLTMAT